MNETLHTVDGRPLLRIERRLAHAPEKVWRALTDPAELSRWYPATASKMDLRVGGAIVFDYGEGTVSDAVIVELDPPRVFALRETAPEQMIRESEGVIRFELRPDGAGCLLSFTQTFDDRPAAASYAGGWRCCLDVLETVLDGHPIEHPRFPVDVHQSLVRRFGLDAGSAQDTVHGWRVRFERQLMMQPIEAVWAELTAAHEPIVGAAPPPGFTVIELPAGDVTELRAPTLLEYGWDVSGRPAGRVRWELSTGPGGARIVLTQTGPGELTEARSIALAVWRARIETLVEQLSTPAG